jgi:hypothetical protein
MSGEPARHFAYEETAMENRTQELWEIIARAHHDEWNLYDPRERVGANQETDRELAPDGMTPVDEGTEELQDGDDEEDEDVD